MRYLLNAFSPTMIEGEALVKLKEIDLVKFTQIFNKWIDNSGYVSAIGHESTAQLLSTLLDCSIPCKREFVCLKAGDEFLIITLGFRLEEGRVYSFDELSNFLAMGKIRLFYGKVLK